MQAFATAFLVLVVCAIQAGCVGAPPTQAISIVYTDEEFARYTGTGDARVFGQAFLRQRGGAVVVCAGAPVVLFPHTATFEHAVDLARQRIQPMPAADGDERFKKVARKATCDAQGNFTFDRVPRAKWYIYSRVVWSAGDYPQGGDLIGEVDTSNGGERQILLTDQNRI